MWMGIRLMSSPRATLMISLPLKSSMAREEMIQNTNLKQNLEMIKLEKLFFIKKEDLVLIQES